MSRRIMHQPSPDRETLDSGNAVTRYQLNLAPQDRDVCDKCNATPAAIHYLRIDRPGSLPKSVNGSMSLMLCGNCLPRELQRIVDREGR